MMAARRDASISSRKIGECEPALANLRVCFTDMNENCGKCAKCVRTMIALTLLGASAAPFPPLPSASDDPQTQTSVALRPYTRTRPSNLPRWPGGRENRRLCRALHASRRRNALRQIAKDLDEVLEGGRCQKIILANQEDPSRVRFGATPDRHRALRSRALIHRLLFRHRGGRGTSIINQPERAKCAQPAEGHAGAGRDPYASWHQPEETPLGLGQK